MAVTLQQIADAAGVSRRTVDRALKDQGRVRPEVAEKIKKLAEEMGYHPNQAGRALALARNPIKVGVITQSSETPFMKEVLVGVNDARKRVRRNGADVEICRIDGVDARQVIACMEKLRDSGVRGLAMVPAEDEGIRLEIDRLSEEEHIPVVTFNSDVSDSSRICFVGQNNKKAGQTAAGLMADCLKSHEQIAIITGSAGNPALNSRVKGFKETLSELRPDLIVNQVYYIADDELQAEEITVKLLNEFPQTKGIFVSAPAVLGVCRALQKKGVEREITVIANDVLDENVKLLEEGTINYLIGQEAYVQGYEAVMILYRYLLEDRKPKKELEYTDIIIKNRYNI
ncbi:MAG: LacI family DNA-binding transcriptional regulator [Muricomes sp.]